jgi:hypothetical protein
MTGQEHVNALPILLVGILERKQTNEDYPYGMACH